MHRFRHHAFKILLATDVAARGIDVKDLTHVIHYQLPDEIENYTHRSGRTARAGKTGISLTLLNMREAFKIRQIERSANIRFERVMIPTMESVAEKKVKNFIEKISGEHLTTGPYAKLIEEILPAFDDMSKEEVIQRFLSNEFKKYKVETDGYNDLNVNDRDGRIIESHPAAGTRMFINIGSKDGLNNGTMKDFILSVTNIDTNKIERCDVKGVYSFINLADDVVTLVMDAMNGSQFKGRTVRMEKTGDEAPERAFSPRAANRGPFKPRIDGERKPFYKGGERTSSRGGDRDSRGGDRDSRGSRDRRDGGPGFDRPSGDRPSGDRPSGDRPSFDRPSGDRPGGSRGSGGSGRNSGGTGRSSGASDRPRREGGNRTGNRR
jgi:ATP-dependent RNA helicase DeaD